MILMNQNQKLVTKRGKDVDFVFVYEVKNREIQGISLIAYELVKRGYTVGFVNAWHGLHNDDVRYRAKAAIVFEAYNTDVLNFALSFIEHCDHVFNMQWEQILCDVCLEEGSLYILTGEANRVYHASWGEANYRHLIDICGIPEDKVKIVGHVGLDPARERFKGYYKSKEEICKEFGIKESRQLALFISSFSNHCNKSQEFQDFARDSQTEILKWLIKYASENENIQVIYRPHPAEVTNKELREKLESLENVSVISQYSIQQWISISDVILNWWSTSMGDIAVSEKSSVILRPCEIPAEYEYYPFKNAIMAHTYEEMIEQIKSAKSPVEKAEMDKYYHFEDRMAYEKIADELEKLLELEPTYVHNCVKKKKLKEFGFILTLRENYGLLKAYLAKRAGKKNEYDTVSYHLRMAKLSWVPEKEIIAIMERFRGLM